MSVCFPDLVFIYVYNFNNIIRRGINWEIFPYFNHFVNCTQLNIFDSCIFLHKDVCEELNHFLLDYICFVLRFENTHEPLNELLLLDTTRTFIHGQILCIITWQTWQIESTPVSSARIRYVQQCGLSTRNIHQYPVLLTILIVHFDVMVQEAYHLTFPSACIIYIVWSDAALWLKHQI